MNPSVTRNLSCVFREPISTLCDTDPGFLPEVIAGHVECLCPFMCLARAVFLAAKGAFKDEGRTINGRRKQGKVKPAEILHSRKLAGGNA